MPAFFVFPDQVFADISRLPKDTVAYFFESDWHTKRLPFHKQKLILQRAAMQAMRERLLTRGYKVEWIEGTVEKLLRRIKNDGFAEASHYAIANLPLAQEVAQQAKQEGLRLTAVPSAQFMTKPGLPTSSWAAFYATFRLEYLILITQGKPTGGRWSFAIQPKTEGAYVSPLGMEDDRYGQEAVAYVQARFPKNPGDGSSCVYPVTHNDATEFLEDFLEFRLKRAGEMNGFVSSQEAVMAYSMFTPLLHVGLLTTHQVISAALAYAEINPIPLAALEAFIREIVREYEYLYALHCAKPRAYTGQKPVLTLSETGLPPIDTALYRLQVSGYLQPSESALLQSFLMMLELPKEAITAFLLANLVGSADWSVLSVPGALPISAKTVLLGSNYDKGAWCEQWDILYQNYLLKKSTLSYTESKEVQDKDPKQIQTLARTLIRRYIGV